MRGLDNDRLECEEGHYWLMVAGCVDERALVDGSWLC